MGRRYIALDAETALNNNLTLPYLLDIMCVNLPVKMLITIKIIDTVWAFIKILSIPNEEWLSETAVGSILLSKLYDFFIGFVNPPPPLIWGSVMLYMQSPKGACRSISDDLSCSLIIVYVYFIKNKKKYIFVSAFLVK